MWNILKSSVCLATRAVGKTLPIPVNATRSILSCGLKRFSPCIKLKAHMTSATWDYSLLHGPHRWSEHWKCGNHQSPIDIITKEAKYDKTLASKSIVFGNKQVPLTLQNTGATVQISPQEITPKLYVSGGPLQDHYEFAQFHFHWGKTNCCGAEHTVDGHQYSAELHLVHWNSNKYRSFQDSLEHQDGLCVLGVFLELEKQLGHNSLEILTRQFKNIEYKGQTAEVENAYDPYSLMPRNTNDYWTYPGSLTTPPLSESVVWIVFREPIPVSQTQMKHFRDLKAVFLEDKDKKDIHDPMDHKTKHLGSGPPPIGDNFRSPMPINSRAIRSSFA